MHIDTPRLRRVSRRALPLATLCAALAVALPAQA